MKSMELIRVAYTDNATFGVLKHEGIPFALTLERPWRNNENGKSCIPEGVYRVLRCRKSPDYGFKDSPQFGNTFQVYQVPKRNLILFHKGNIDDDTRGCILVGEQFEVVKGEAGIAASKQGFEQFLDKLKDVDEFELTIRNAGAAGSDIDILTFGKKASA
jgi:hypothetical protein